MRFNVFLIFIWNKEKLICYENINNLIKYRLYNNKRY